jgi:hypothetical protein
MTEDTEDPSQTDWESGVARPGPNRKSVMGHEIPVPKRDSIFAAFKKIIPPVKKR